VFLTRLFRLVFPKRPVLIPIHREFHHARRVVTLLGESWLERECELDFRATLDGTALNVIDWDGTTSWTDQVDDAGGELQDTDRVTLTVTLTPPGA
jgi:hypothetical protein